MTQLAKSDLATLAHEINSEHAAVGHAIAAGLAHAVRAGELLINAKAIVGHGQWIPWLNANTAVSERTAQAYMRVAREYPTLAERNPQRVADLSFRDAVKLLAEPKPPAVEPANGVDPASRVDRITEAISALAEAPAGSAASLAEWMASHRNAEEILSMRDRVQDFLADLLRGLKAAALIPPSGYGLHGTHGDDEVFITPSSTAGHYFVTRHQHDAEGNVCADGLKKPVRHDAIETVLSCLGFDPDIARWETEPWPALKFNVWLYDSERHYIDEAVLGKKQE